MKKIQKAAVLTYATIILPFVVSAQRNPLSIGSTDSGTKDLKYLIGVVISYFNIILALLMGLAVIAFVFYVIKYFILKPDMAKKEGNLYVMWSLIGFFVILSFWGLVNILVGTFDFGQNNPGTWSN